jgi:hypothetical protein
MKTVAVDGVSGPVLCATEDTTVQGVSALTIPPIPPQLGGLVHLVALVTHVRTELVTNAKQAHTKMATRRQVAKTALVDTTKMQMVKVTAKNVQLERLEILLSAMPTVGIAKVALLDATKIKSIRRPDANFVLLDFMEVQMVRQCPPALANARLDGNAPKDLVEHIKILAAT